jgi:hypothetical protein
LSQIARRHLTAGQRADAAAAIATVSHGGDRKSANRKSDQAAPGPVDRSFDWPAPVPVSEAEAAVRDATARDPAHAIGGTRAATLHVYINMMLTLRLVRCL